MGPDVALGAWSMMLPHQMLRPHLPLPCVQICGLMGLGVALGAWIAKSIKITELPQMVAGFRECFRGLCMREGPQARREGEMAHGRRII